MSDEYRPITELVALTEGQLRARKSWEKNCTFPDFKLNWHNMISVKYIKRNASEQVGYAGNGLTLAFTEIWSPAVDATPATWGVQALRYGKPSWYFSCDTMISVTNQPPIQTKLCTFCSLAALWMVFSVRLSVTHFWQFSDYVPIIVSSWNSQELLPMTKVTSMQKVKVRGQRSRSQRSTPNLTVSGL